MFQKMALATCPADFVEIGGIGEHDLRALAAKLKDDPLEVRFGRPVEELAPDLGRSGEGDRVDVRVPADRLTDRRTGPRDNIEHAVRQPGF